VHLEVANMTMQLLPRVGRAVDQVSRLSAQRLVLGLEVLDHAPQASVFQGHLSLNQRLQRQRGMPWRGQQAAPTTIRGRMSGK